jgi:hypothetical protein
VKYFATRLFAALIAPLALASCASGRGGDRLASAETNRARVVAMSNWMIQVEMQSPGQFVNQRSLPLDPNVKAYVGDKRVDVSQIKIGSAVTIYRDAETHRVLKIAAD